MDFFFRYFFSFFLIRELHSAVKNGEHFASCNNFLLFLFKWLYMLFIL